MGSSKDSPETHGLNGAEEFDWPELGREPVDATVRRVTRNIETLASTPLYQIADPSAPVAAGTGERTARRAWTDQDPNEFPLVFRDFRNQWKERDSIWLYLAAVLICVGAGAGVATYLASGAKSGDSKNIIIPRPDAIATAPQKDARQAAARTSSVTARTAAKQSQPLLTSPQNVLKLTESENPADITVKNASGFAGTPIRLHILGSFDRAKPDSALIIRGVPKGVRLSAGSPTLDGWHVPITSLSGLSLTAPEAFSGTLTLDFALKTGDQISPFVARALVRIEPQPTPSVAAPEQISKALEAALLSRGGRLLAAGDIGGARLAYEHLAVRGSVQAAYSLAQTYDSEFLATIDVVGLQPNTKRAVEWYRKAASMGSKGAIERLQALSVAQ